MREVRESMADLLDRGLDLRLDLCLDLYLRCGRLAVLHLTFCNVPLLILKATNLYPRRKAVQNAAQAGRSCLAHRA